MNDNNEMDCTGCCWFNYSCFGGAQLECFCLEGHYHILFLRLDCSSEPSTFVTCFHRADSSLLCKKTVLTTLVTRLTPPFRHLCVVLPYPLHQKLLREMLLQVQLYMF